MPLSLNHLKSNRAAALLLVMWAVLFLSFGVLSVVQFLSRRADERIADFARFKAKLLAESGLAVGMHPKVKPDDPLLHAQTTADSGYDVQVSREGARLSINAISLTRMQETIKRLLKQWNMDDTPADEVIAAMRDWVDEDSNELPGGAEKDAYEKLGFKGYPLNRAFTSLDELRLVKGWDLVESIKPDWRNYFTVFGEGEVDLNVASAEVIEAMCDLSEGSAESFVTDRDGADQKNGTPDDQRSTDKAAALNALGIKGEAATALESWTTIDHSIYHVESTGRIGLYTATIVVVAERDSAGALTFLSRAEN